MPRPISAAFRANSDRAPLLGPFTSPIGELLAARLWASVSKDCRWAPPLVELLVFCAWARTALNSAVRSCIELITIVGYLVQEPQGVGNSIKRCSILFKLAETAIML